VKLDLGALDPADADRIRVRVFRLLVASPRFCKPVR